MKIVLILLAGGLGTRMKHAVPKTFHLLSDKPLILHSYERFEQISSISKTVIVCPEEYRNIFPPDTLFAKPGLRRQDSVKSGLDMVESSTDYVLVHDGARPFIEKGEVERLIAYGLQEEAAALATPIRSTLKRVNSINRVTETPSRDDLWEVQTPQMIRYELITSAFKKAEKDNLTVTDDIALAELMGYAPLLIRAKSFNMKITYPEDFTLAERLLCPSLK